MDMVVILENPGNLVHHLLSGYATQPDDLSNAVGRSVQKVRQVYPRLPAGLRRQSSSYRDATAREELANWSLNACDKSPSQMNPKKRSKSFSGNHQRSWLWGHHAVLETLNAAKWPVRELYVNQTSYDSSRELLQTKQRAGLAIEIVTSERLEQLTGSGEHQGLVARMGQYPYLPEEQLHRWLQLKSPDPQQPKTSGASLQPLVVVCDRIQDAFNFGAILRCCDGACVLAVIVGRSEQAEVTPHVARASSGAVNYVPVTQSANIVASVIALKQLGLQVVAADSNATNSVWQAPLAGPTALILGSEASGVNRDLLDVCDQIVSIPMQGRVTSLNAAVAAGILLFEIRRQQSLR